MCALFAATHPDRTTAIILFGSYARRLQDADYAWGSSAEEYQAFIDEMARDWGGPVGLKVRAPSKADDARFRENWARYLRLGASPSAVVALARMNAEIDIRAVLPAIGVPTLVLHRAVGVGAGRHLGAHIPGASYVELAGEDHLPWVGDTEAVLGEIEEFLTGIRRAPEGDRILATVLFTDIVGSTERAAALGDEAWRDLLGAHHDRVRREIERFRGREIDTTGDGFLATFDGPARAVRCAQAIATSVKELGMEIRAGLHTGEIQVVGDDVLGIAVHVGARISALAGPSEVLVSSTVKDLTAGSGLVFEDRGTHTLKGVPDEWHVYAVRPD
jgi:class 3 adenylate cyclase